MCGGCRYPCSHDRIKFGTMRDFLHAVGQ
jgi:hypothetical protein